MLPDVDVRSAGPGEFHVEVRQGSSVTSHRVTIRDATRADLGFAEADDRRLVEESFAFLLERESKESILASFDLSVIARYFPEYPDEIRRRMGA